MNEILNDLLTLLRCGVNTEKPSEELVRRYQDQTDGKSEHAEKLRTLYQLSRSHFVDALTGTVLKQAGVRLPAEWEQSVAKAIRKVILFDAERAELLKFFEQNKIWYLPLKGIILKEYYPSVGMRQMSDNDILFDEKYADEVRNYMVSRGYTVESFGQGNHDVYEKEPVYNFEMHRALYGAAHDNNWEMYYKDVKSRLLRDEESSFGYHMTAEDFYMYIICHGYKHYKGSGTGIRTLLDFYVFLKGNEGKLDFSYIETECEKLKIADFEKESRILCQKVFGMSGKAAQTVDMDEWRENLSESEQEMLAYYMSSGVYGTTERGVKNRMKQCTTKNGKTSKVRYVLRRLFPGKEVYQYYPFVAAHKWILPEFYIWRMIRMVFVGERRERILREVKIVRKVD